MKRFLCLLFLFMILFSCALSAQTTPPKQPVFIYLRMHVSDQFNLDMTEDRLRRVLPMLERYRKEHPAAGASATILFSGAVSQALAERNGKTGIRDFILDYARRGVIEVGYDGTNEPTGKQAPLADYGTTATPKEHWLSREVVAQLLLTEARDPLTGARVPSATGGLLKMQEVFGEAACITGVEVRVRDEAIGSMPDVGGDSEIINEVRRYNTKAIMFGLRQSGPAHIDFYEEWAASFSKGLSPTPQTPPELFWQENVLRTSERSDMETRVAKASEGAQALKEYFGKLERTKIRIVHVELGDDQNYLLADFTKIPNYPPARYASLHPGDPKLPATAFRGTDAVKAAFEKEEGVLKWLSNEFYPANPGSHIVSSSDLKRMTPPSSGYEISVKSLRSALQELEKSWGDGRILPKYILTDGHYLSLADTFQVMAEALAELYRKGQLPEKVKLLRVYGPVDMSTEKTSAEREVTAAAVARSTIYVIPRLYDDAWSPIPRNSIPGRVHIDDLEVSAAQYFRLMVEALNAPSPETKLKPRPMEMTWGPDALFLRTRPVTEMGLTWTFKPAPVDDAQATMINH